MDHGSRLRHHDARSGVVRCGELAPVRGARGILATLALAAASALLAACGAPAMVAVQTLRPASYDLAPVGTAIAVSVAPNDAHADATRAIGAALVGLIAGGPNHALHVASDPRLATVRLEAEVLTDEYEEHRETRMMVVPIMMGRAAGMVTLAPVIVAVVPARRPRAALVAHHTPRTRRASARVFPALARVFPALSTRWDVRAFSSPGLTTRWR